MSASASVLLDAILPVGNHAISEYLRREFGRGLSARPGNGASSGNRPGAPGTAAGHFTFQGNGIADATFSQPEAVAIAELHQVLGSPTTPRLTGDAGNCTVDASLTWPTMTAYFLHGRLVGYNSASLLAA